MLQPLTQQKGSKNAERIEQHVYTIIRIFYFHQKIMVRNSRELELRDCDCKAAVRTCVGSGNQPQRRSKGVKTPIRKARILLSITAEFQLLCPAPHSSGSFALFQRSFESPLPIIPEPHIRKPPHSVKLRSSGRSSSKFPVFMCTLPQLRISFTNTQTNKQRIQNSVGI
jgi:hypothetical protein